MRKNPHVRICGGLGSATTLVYPTPMSEPQRDLRRSAGRRGETGALIAGNRDLCGCALSHLHDGARRG